MGRLKGIFIKNREFPAVEFNADIPFNPGKTVFLADGANHIIAGNNHRVFAGRDQHAAAILIELLANLLEFHADQATFLDKVTLGDVEIKDRDVFGNCVFNFPGRRLHFIEAAAYSNSDCLSSQSLGGSAAVHSGIAAPQHNDALANSLDMLECHVRQPFYPRVNSVLHLRIAGEIKMFTKRSPGPNKDRIVGFVEQAFHAGDFLTKARIDTHVEDVIEFFFEHLYRQSEAGDLCAHCATTHCIALK